MSSVRLRLHWWGNESQGIKHSNPDPESLPGDGDGVLSFCISEPTQVLRAPSVLGRDEQTTAWAALSWSGIVTWVGSGLWRDQWDAGWAPLVAARTCADSCPSGLRYAPYDLRTEYRYR